MNARDRFRGCLLGLAAGDAVGTTLEFEPPGSFAPIADMVGGGPFGLKPGEWTDDTSMALCLAESLIERAAFDPADQLERYVRWWKLGHLSSTGVCFDIGNTTAGSLRTWLATRSPWSGPTGAHTAGNGALMRLAPVPMAFAERPEQAIELAGQSSRTTHGAAASIDACRYYAGLIAGALRGAPKDDLLSPRYAPVPGYWAEHALDEEVARVADGSFKRLDPPAIQGTGHVVRALEAALWAFDRSASFREGCLLAANLGHDADTTAAIYGQLAGACYGVDGIPAAWRAKLALLDVIEDFADRLFTLSRALA